MKPPIEVVSLFPLLDKELISLLQLLDENQWQAQTIAKLWNVKDVAAHLLDGNMRTISSFQNYSYSSPGNITSYQELVDYLNGLNADWVKAMKRVSPAQLIDLLASTGKQYCKLMAEAPLFTPAPFSVAWAGEEVSMNWFHLAREYTEKWHHQMQIRKAVGKEDALMTRTFFYPFIDTLMYGLPHALRQISAEYNNSIQVNISGNTGGDWFVNFTAGKWSLSKSIEEKPLAYISIDPTIAWQLFTKGISPDEAAASAGMQGNMILCEAVLKMVAVMA